MSKKEKDISRRDFLRSLSSAVDQKTDNKRKNQTLNKSFVGGQGPTCLEKRLELIASLKELKESRQEIPPDMLDKLPVTGIEVSEECTACAACEKVCPAGALRLVKEEEESSFKLIFSPANCTVCDLCKNACRPGALHYYPLSLSPDLEELKPVVLRSGALQTCIRCGAEFYNKTISQRCPTCEFRARNPFGSIHIPS